MKLRLILASALLGATIAVASATPLTSTGASMLGNNLNREAASPVVKVFSNPKTTRIIRKIRSGSSQCRSLPREYRHDCMRSVYASASSIAGRSGPDYRKAASLLRSASKGLSSIARKNRDRSAPKRKRFSAVSKSKVSVADRAARALLENVAASLKQHGVGKRIVKIHYDRIASSVSSSKKVFGS